MEITNCIDKCPRYPYIQAKTEGSKGKHVNCVGVAHTIHMCPFKLKGLKRNM